MEQSFENENICDIFMNEVRIQNEPLHEFLKNVNVQIEGNRNSESNEKKIKKFLKSYMQKDYSKNLMEKMFCVGHIIVF
jgi:hypothetical protein